MKDISKIIEADFKKFPILNYLNEESKKKLFEKYNLSNFFLFKRKVKLIIINILNKILRNKIYSNNSRSLENVQKKYDKISGTYIHSP